MQYKTLGDTGLLVSTICFGCMTFHGGSGFWSKIGQVDQAGADDLVKGCLDAGVNFFDTADVYSEGESEKTLGQSLKNLGIARKDVVIATKVFGRTGPGRNDIGASRGHIMDAVDASLQRLGTDHIDLYQIHGNDVITPIEETLRALDTLVQQGKIRYIGASNWEAWKLSRAITTSELKGYARFDTLQAYYSIAGRDLEREFVPMFQHTRTGLLVWSPLAGGLLSGKFSRDNQKPEGTRRSEFDFPLVDKERAWRILDVMRPIAEAHGGSPARIALAWLLHQPVVTSVIIGAKRPDQLHDNLAAVDLKLSPEELKQLDEISRLPPEYPGWMLPSRAPAASTPTSAAQTPTASKLRGLRTYLYKLTSDRGGAPCAPPPRAGTVPLLTLALCKPAIRRTAQPGDRIVGLTSRVLELSDGYPPLSVIYTATITAVLDATAYYSSTSPHLDRPDCIYRYHPRTGDIQHAGQTGLHADPRHRRRDLGKDGLFENARVLLSRQFTYLGSAALVLPFSLNRLRELASILGQGHRVVADGQDASLDCEIGHLFRTMHRRPTRFTPQEVHADAYDHPKSNPADTRQAQRTAQVCNL